MHYVTTNLLSNSTLKKIKDSGEKDLVFCYNHFHALNFLKSAMKIRKAKASDTLQLEELFLITRRKTFSWEKPSKFKLLDYKKSTQGESVFIAEDSKGKIVGFISVWEKDPPPFIHHLFVHPDSQRKGVGTMLIQSLFPWLPRPYRLKCLVKNQNAVAFYLKTNWTIIGKGVEEEGEYLLLELQELASF